MKQAGVFTVKRLAILACTLLILASILLPRVGAVATSVTEGFEWGVDGDNVTDDGGDVDWSKSTPGTCSATISTEQAHSGSRSLRLYRDSTNWPFVSFVLAPGDREYELSFWVYHPSGVAQTFDWGNGTKRVNGGIGGASAKPFYVDAGGAYVYAPTHNTVVGGWNHVVVSDVSFSSGTYDITVNEVKWFDDVPMQLSATGNGLWRFLGATASSAYWVDDVVVTRVLPQPPTNFTATPDGDYQVNLSWVKGTGATYTIVLRKVGSTSENTTDGVLVYWGTDNIAVDDINLLFTEGTIYYSAWSWNDQCYSTSPATDTVSTGGTMSNAIIFIGLSILGLGILALGIIQSKWWLNLISGIVWLALAVWGFTSYEALYDLNFIIGCVGVFLLTVCIFQPIISVMAKSGDKAATEGALESRWEARESKWASRTAIPESWRKRRNQE